MTKTFPLLLVMLATLTREASMQELQGTTQQPQTWTGRWLPDRSHDELTTPAAEHDLHDPHHGVKMGQSSVRCDNAKVNLTLDWDYNPINYTCFYSERILPDLTVHPLLECESIPKAYTAVHICMRKKIHYHSNIPTFGPHRPLWAKYGEYVFVPVQRWMHNLEHGAVVMLYHPCANPLEVKRLRTLVTSCIRKHVITRYNLLDKERPLALLTWGCRLTMSVVSDDIVREFIKKYALHGPEQIHADGQFSEGLAIPAANVSKMGFDELCPN